MSFSREELSNKLIQDFIAEFDNEKPEGHSGLSIKIMVGLIVIGVAAFVSYALYSDKVAISRSDGSEIPFVKADTTPVRERPDDPGGMYIANRDKNVYEAISSSSKKLPKVIRLMPEPEEPLTREVIKNTDTGDTTQVATLLDDLSKNNPAEMSTAPEKTALENKAETPAAEPAPTAPTENKMIVKQELASKEVTVETPMEQKPEEAKPAAAEEATPPKKALTIDDIKVVPVLRNKPQAAPEPQKPVETKAAGNYKIQLGSFRSEEDVQSTWSKIKGENSEVFANTQLHIEKADLGAKGLFYRLQVSNIKTESEARKMCQKLIINKQGCFVVKK